MKNHVAVNNVTLIQKNTRIEGDINSEGKVHISGFLKGNVSTKEHVVINQDGSIKGNVITQRAEISGEVHGDLRVTDLVTLKSTARVFGNIYAKYLVTEEGAQMNGEIYSGKDVDILGKKDQEIQSNMPPQRKAG